ncbi:hypothetical protein GCM10010116_41830 [Microbispora rosea subsp. aerata]|nr:hypothetical protein GCM10010116_41830 [Microbispora rosea subsp. aerata]GIH56080.1 hypothetical protein Mro02_29940 [Microbispora rosea subsp. aerata]GLJ85645.1 hypothetical protein GCM10017588_43780 [Microbispora rosea subsp. aerata]
MAGPNSEVFAEVSAAVLVCAMKRGLSLIFARDHLGREPELAPVPAGPRGHEFDTGEVAGASQGRSLHPSG